MSNSDRMLGQTAAFESLYKKADPIELKLKGYYCGIDVAKGEDFTVEVRQAARDSLPENEIDYYTEWSAEFGVDRSLVKRLSMPYFYDNVSRSMSQIKELVKLDIKGMGQE